MLLRGLLFWLGLLPLTVLAALDDKAKLANRTIERTISLRTHSLFPPYIDQDLQNRWWDFGGDAYVNTNKHIRLTRHRPSQMGWLWSRVPLTAANFILEVEFKIHGDNSHLYGDGIAVWIAKDRAKPGPVFGSIDKFEGLGVFLDTYANARHPYAFPRITAMLGDGKAEYDHDNDGERGSIGACSANYRHTNVATKLRITYIREQYLNVKIQYRAWDEWTECFTVEGLVLPVAPYVGFSALTGDISDNHDIISVDTHSAILSSLDSQRDQLKGSRKVLVPGAGGSWTGTLFKLLLFGGVVVGALYGYRAYAQKRGGGAFGRGGFGAQAAGFGGALYGDSKRF